MDIKEIAERVSKRIYVEDGLLLSKFISEKFAEALIAEIAKQNEPAVWWNKDTCQFFIGEIADVERKDLFEPLFAIPPTTSQIEQETAEACAKVIDQEACGGSAFNSASEYMAKKIRNGAWKEFKK